MTQAKKSMKAKPKAGTNFIKLDTLNTEKEIENNEPVVKRKNIISGSKEAIKTRGVIYVSHLPHGFYENQLRKYLEQFGSVTNIKVGRSEKTGKSRGYAFVEFRYHEVAKTVAETMNNYLFFDKLLKCELVPQEKIRPSIFRNKINPKKIPLKKSRALAKREVNKTRDELQEQKRRRKQLQGLKKKAATLKSLGIECTLDFPTIEKEISDRKTRIKETGGKTPTMAVDDSDLDITLKTPPMVRKVKSRPTSAATPQGSTKLSEASISKKLMKRKLAMKADVEKEEKVTVENDTVDNKKINKLKKKEKPIKGSPNSRKLLTPQIKAGSGVISKSPKSAKKNSMKARRRSEPIK